MSREQQKYSEVEKIKAEYNKREKAISTLQKENFKLSNEFSSAALTYAKMICPIKIGDRFHHLHGGRTKQIFEATEITVDAIYTWPHTLWVAWVSPVEKNGKIEQEKSGEYHETITNNSCDIWERVE